MRNITRTLLADAGLLYAAAIWGSTFIIVKVAVSDVHPVMLVAWRFLIAAALLGLILVFRGRPLWKNWKNGLLLGAVLWCLYAPQTIGLVYTSASNSGFITGLFVAFLPPLYYLFYRKVPPLMRQVAVVISLAGLWILTGGLTTVNTGDLLTLLAALFYALHILVADSSIKKGMDPYALSFQQFLTVGLLSLLAGVLFGLPFEAGSDSALWAILFLALFPTLSAFVIQLVAQRIAGPVKVSLIFATEPLFAALFAWSFGGEQFILHRALGGLLIVVAIVLSELPVGKKQNNKAE